MAPAGGLISLGAEPRSVEVEIMPLIESRNAWNTLQTVKVDLVTPGVSCTLKTPPIASFIFGNLIQGSFSSC